MAQFIDIDFSQIAGFGEAFARAPRRLVKAVAVAFRRMGKGDIDKLKREQLSGGGGHLNIRRKGLKNAFKYKSSNPDSAQQFDQLLLDEYTGWKAFRIFETGGTIIPRTKRLLTVLTDKARDGSGRRKYTQKQLSSMIRSGELRIVRTKKILMVVRNVGGRNKSGGFRKNSRNDIIAFLVPEARMRKMLDFYGNFDRNATQHQKLLELAAQETLDAVAGDRGGSGDQ